MEILKMSMPAFADWLAPLIGRPVIDATGLKGFYKMTIEFPPDVLLNAIPSISNPPSDLVALTGATPFSGPAGAARGTPGPAANASDPPGKPLFAAVEKRGLRLESRKAPIPTLVIEHIEKNPTEN